MDAVNRANEITTKLLLSGCNYLINIVNQTEPIVEHQLKLASGTHTVYQVKSKAAAEQLKTKILAG